jgi:hypothetical protein
MSAKEGTERNLRKVSAHYGSVCEFPAGETVKRCLRGLERFKADKNLAGVSLWHGRSGGWEGNFSDASGLSRPTAWAWNF